jgi:VWFA-related protein
MVLRGSLLALAAAGGLALADGRPALAAPAAGAGSASAQPSAQPSGQGFAETTQVTAVEVPVQVLRDGEPVRGLTAADFEVWEGRKRHAITGFDVVDLAKPENQLLSASLPAAGRRHFLLVFDLSNSTPNSMIRARDAVKRSLLAMLVPSDLVAVASYGAKAGLKLMLAFTSDRRQIMKAVDSLGLSDAVDRVRFNPMMLTMADISDMQDQFAQFDPTAPAPPDMTRMQQARYNRENGVAPAGRPPTPLPNAGNFTNSMANTISLFAVQSLMNQRSNQALARDSVMALTRSFADLARMMDAVSGRKLVVYFSQGFDSKILEGDQSLEAQQAMADTAMRGWGAFTSSEERYGSTHETNQVEKMLEMFRRSGCVIESVDIGGLRNTENIDASGAGGDSGTRIPSGETALFQMAHDTGGELFHNFNDLGQAMQRLAATTSVTYVLTFQPEGPLAAGSYHPIKVKLKDAPRGARVTYKPGYYAPRPFRQQRPLERTLAAADRLMSGDTGGSIATAVLAAPFQGSGDRAYVPVIVEAEGASLLAGQSGKALPAEIYAYAVDAQGTIADYFDQVLGLDVEKAGAALRQGGLKFFGHLELPPGEYSVRVLLRNGETGAWGKRATLVNVPAFAAAKPVLLPPFFPEASGRWTVVRESPRGQQRDASYPFTVGERAYVPAAVPELVPGQTAAVALVGYHMGDSEVQAQARVLGADGRDLGGGELRLAGREAGAGGRPDVWRAVFQAPPGLAPGRYQLVVTVTGPGGSETGATLFSIPAPAAPVAASHAG